MPQHFLFFRQPPPSEAARDRFQVLLRCREPGAVAPVLASYPGKTQSGCSCTPCTRHQAGALTLLALPQVHLQTQQEVKMRMMGMAMHVIRNDGFLALYNGLSASLCRQVSATVPRWPLVPHGVPATALPLLSGSRAGADSLPSGTQRLFLLSSR